MNPRVGLVILAVYSALLIIGGVVGFVRARSVPSLVAGVVSGLVAAGAADHAATKNEDAGYALALALAVVLFLLFGYRWTLARRFMPSGLLAIVSAVVMAVMVWSIII